MTKLPSWAKCRAEGAVATVTVDGSRSAAL